MKKRLQAGLAGGSDRVPTTAVRRPFSTSLRRPLLVVLAADSCGVTASLPSWPWLKIHDFDSSTSASGGEPDYWAMVVVRLRTGVS